MEDNGGATQMLTIRDLRFRWPGAASDTLRVDRLDIAAARTHFLHGPSGCGKSTLLALMAGVLVAGRGQVVFDGQDWASLRAGGRDALRADRIGVIFQQFNLLPYLSVRDNVRLPCRVSARRAARCEGGDKTQAEALLQAMGLAAHDWDRRADALSVGQQQRVAAARALIGQPSLVIADEPTSALDAPLRDAFLDLLLGHCRAHGTALVFVSHDERLAARFDQVISLPEVNRAAAPGHEGRATAPAEEGAAHG